MLEFNRISIVMKYRLRLSKCKQMRLHEVTQEYFIKLKWPYVTFAMIFTGFRFNGITKTQRYLQSVINYDYSIAQLYLPYTGNL